MGKLSALFCPAEKKNIFLERKFCQGWPPHPSSLIPLHDNITNPRTDQCHLDGKSKGTVALKRTGLSQERYFPWRMSKLPARAKAGFGLWRPLLGSGGNAVILSWNLLMLHIKKLGSGYKWLCYSCLTCWQHGCIQDSEKPGLVFQFYNTLH